MNILDITTEQWIISSMEEDSVQMQLLGNVFNSQRYLGQNTGQLCLISNT